MKDGEKAAVVLVLNEHVALEEVCRLALSVLLLGCCTYARAIPRGGSASLASEDKAFVVLVGCYEDGVRFAETVGDYKAWLLTKCED